MSVTTLFRYHPTSCFSGKFERIKKQDPAGRVGGIERS